MRFFRHAAMTVLAVALPSISVAEIPTDRSVRLKNAATKLYLTAISSKSSMGSEVVQWTPTTNGSDYWWFQSEDDGSYKLRNASDTNYLAVSGGSTRPGSPVILWPNKNQLDLFWRPETLTGDCYRFINQNSDLFLSISGNRRFRGVNAILDDEEDQDTIWCVE